MKHTTTLFLLATTLTGCVAEVTRSIDEATEEPQDPADDAPAAVERDTPTTEDPAPEPVRATPAPPSTCVEGDACAPWPGFAGWTYVCAIGQAPPSPTCAAVEPGVFCCP